MCDILFFAQNRHQFNYFTQLKNSLNLDIEVVKSTHLCYKKIVDVSTILNYKKNEIFNKYSLFKANIYFQYIKFITPFFECNYEYFIKKYNPKMIGIWNGVKYPQNIAVKIAKNFNKKVVFFENGFLPNRTQMDFNGVNALNSLPRDKEFYEKLNYKDINLPKELIPRKFEGKQKLNEVELPKNYIFVPFQVGYDSQIIYFSKFKSMRELFYLIKEISDKLNLNFVFKEHPSDKINDYRDLHSQTNEKLLFANKISTQTLIENCDAVITINSSVGIESLLFHKKVYVLGEAFYAIDGITKPTNNLLKELKQDFIVDENLIDKFLKYLFDEYLIPDDWRNPTQKHFKEIEKRIKQELNKNWNNK